MTTGNNSEPIKIVKVAGIICCFYYVLGAVNNLWFLTFTTTVWGMYNYPSVTDEENLFGKVPSPRLHIVNDRSRNWIFIDQSLFSFQYSILLPFALTLYRIVRCLEKLITSFCNVKHIRNGKIERAEKLLEVQKLRIENIGE